jgi:uncharacterized RDD family membrane protein YckC
VNTSCGYCRASNAEEDHRCSRCGRRLQVTPAQAIAAAYGASNTATARAIRPIAEPEPVAAPNSTPEPEAAPSRAIYQRTLFSYREVPQVVSLDSLAPKPAERTRTRTESPRPRARRSDPGQRTLEFTNPEGVDTGVQAVIYCDAPVAIPAHRMMAAAADLSIIVIALGVFLGIFQLLGGQVVLTRQTLPLFIGIATVLGLLYKMLWSLADGDSPGMRWTRLRTVNFDGHQPDREQRLFRTASAFISLMAAGLGLMWALVDEESLTWHDHMSKTFPTPY